MRGDEGVGHVDAHNELRAGLLREAARFATTIDIGGPYSVDDPGHVQEHEKTRAALEAIAKIAGIEVTLPPVRKLGDHAHAPTDHDLLDQALAVISKAEAWNDATGGTITTFTKPDKTVWRVHSFTASGSLVVNRAVRPFRVLVCAGGGGGAGGGPYYGQGGHGGAGGLLEATKTLQAKSYAVTVGNGGNGGQNATMGEHNGRAGGHGQNSVFDDMTAIGGGGGGSYQEAGSSGGSGGGSYQNQGGGWPGTPGQGFAGSGDQDAPGYHSGGGGGAGGPGKINQGGPGKSVDITGTAVTYAAGGPSGSIAGGGGGGQGTDGSAGRGGIVIVSYQIGVAP